MELQTAIEILEYHQEWRLGKREEMIHEPKKLTEALDMVLSEVKKCRLGAVISWMSVSEKLPPIEKDVLVYDGFSIYITNRLDHDGIIWDESNQIFDEITHWMPMPETP